MGKRVITKGRGNVKIVKEGVIMEVKENVKNYLEDETKRLWESIYGGFEREGKDGIKKVLEEEAKRIKDEFGNIKRHIERQIGG